MSPDVFQEPTPKDKDSIDTLFTKYSGADRVIDPKELQSLLNEAFATGMWGSI
jgi:hypothetical protein